MSELLKATHALRWSLSGQLQQLWRGDQGTERWITIPKEEPKGGFQLTAEPVLNGAKRKKDDLFADLLPNEWLSSRKFADAWRGFVEMRALKWPLTERAVRLLVPKLRDIGQRFALSGVLASLDASTVNHWRDLFDPKDLKPVQKPTANVQPERYAKFIQNHPDPKLRAKCPKWSDSAEPSMSWLRSEFRKWEKTGVYPQ